MEQEATLDQMMTDRKNGFLRAGGYNSLEEWARDSDYTERDGGWVDLDGNPVDLEECLLGAMDAAGVIESPSGWSYRAEQENGDAVDCWECGRPLDDNFVIMNDEEKYAYHEACYRTRASLSPTDLNFTVTYNRAPGEDMGAVERALVDYLWEQEGVEDVVVHPKSTPDAGTVSVPIEALDELYSYISIVEQVCDTAIANADLGDYPCSWCGSEEDDHECEATDPVANFKAAVKACNSTPASASATVVDILSIMSGKEWSSDTLDDIAQVLTRHGYKIEGID
jgi:hypothetical protein